MAKHVVMYRKPRIAVRKIKISTFRLTLRQHDSVANDLLLDGMLIAKPCYYPSGGNPCERSHCLSLGTQIAIPGGRIAIEKIRVGDLVYTLNDAGEKIIVPIIRVSSIPVLPTHKMVYLRLSDGRCVLVSPGHPTIYKIPVYGLMVGDLYDNSIVIESKLIYYKKNRTFDLLPLGKTGYYWADNILLGSTLKPFRSLQITDRYGTYFSSSLFNIMNQ